MPDQQSKLSVDPDSYQVAEELATRLEAVGCDYALSGAIAKVLHRFNSIQWPEI